MDKKKYVKPTIEVYELKNQARLLAGSGSGPGERTPYGDPIPGDWGF